MDLHPLWLTQPHPPHTGQPPRPPPWPPGHQIAHNKIRHMGLTMKTTILRYKKRTTTVPIGIVYPRGDLGVVPWDLPHMITVGHPVLMEEGGTITNQQPRLHWFCRQVQTRQLTIRRQLRRRRPQRQRRPRHIETPCFITIRNAIQPRCPFLKFQSIDQVSIGCA